MKSLSLSLLALLILSSNAVFATDLDALLDEISNLDSTSGTVTTTTHNAGEVTIENISYTTDGKDLYTLTWTPIVGDANVKVEIKESKESDFFTLNTVKGSDGKIDIKLPTAGQYQIKLTAIDSASNTAISKEYIQTIKVDGVAPTPTPTPTVNEPAPVVTPTVMDAKTGPGENIMIFTVLMGLMMYGIYRFRRN
jgi:hypothetical protein